MKMLYYAKIQSHLCYGLVAWGQMILSGTVNKLQKQQNTCLELVHGCANTWPKAETDGFLSVRKLMKLELSKVGFKLHHHLLPVPIANAMKMDQSNHWLVDTQV